MHSLTVCKGILDRVIENAQNKKVLSIEMKVPIDEHHSIKNYKDTFELIAKNTLAENAKLNISESSDCEAKLINIEID